MPLLQSQDNLLAVKLSGKTLKRRCILQFYMTMIKLLRGVCLKEHVYRITIAMPDCMHQVVFTEKETHTNHIAMTQFKGKTVHVANRKKASTFFNQTDRL